MKTTIWYTDAITALVRALVPLRDAIEDATRRGDVELREFLRSVYGPLIRKLMVCLRVGTESEDWSPRELLDADADSLSRLLASRKGRAA